jgi:ribosomal-protein-serine acetyltransferase
MNFGSQVDENIRLTLPMPHHAAEIANLVRENLEHLKVWMPWAKDDYSLESAHFYISDNLQQLADGTGFANNIVYQGKICGQIGFHHLDAGNKSVKMGYWIAANLQGRGIVTKCCRAFIDYGFDELNLNRVQINCNVENTKSRRIPERLGFQLEGVQRQAEKLNNRFGDWAIYAMLKEDWEKAVNNYQSTVNKITDNW